MSASMCEFPQANLRECARSNTVRITSQQVIYMAVLRPRQRDITYYRLLQTCRRRVPLCPLPPPPSSRAMVLIQVPWSSRVMPVASSREPPGLGQLRASLPPACRLSLPAGCHSEQVFLPSNSFFLPRSACLSLSRLGHIETSLLHTCLFLLIFLRPDTYR